MAQACTLRGLALSRPVNVRPMTAFQDGYTPGIGSVTWEEEYAEQWRSGWCALGIYCTRESTNEAPLSPNAGNRRAGETTAAESPPRFSQPLGLYDADKNTLFVRDADAPAARTTIAHETVHALQYQNYPRLRAIHLWHNRDLAAAANSAIEGDAHIVGWYFDPHRRLYMCSLDARHAAQSHARWWRWTPHGAWAHEGFPHVFGPELALGRLLAGGRAAVDDLVQAPPLSTLQVLRPEQSGGVDFIDLPKTMVGAELASRGCEAGLANTAGALGIWGLLRQHDAANTSAEELPPLVEHWRGDRFLHVACPGERDDELAWLSHWRHASAAQDFAARYDRIASAVAAHGDVLGAPPHATVHENLAIVVTPGLNHAIPELAAAPTRTFRSYDDWLHSGCFPQRKCDEAEAPAPTETATAFACSTIGAPPATFDRWLDSVRIARADEDVAVAEADAIIKAAGDLATFCAVNAANNKDLARACRAAHLGIPFQTQLLKDPNWRGLPHCATQGDVRSWLRALYFADAKNPYSAPSTFAEIYGPALAAAAFAGNRASGLKALASAPPLSTRQIFWPQQDATVDFIHFPPTALAPLNCEATTTNVRGVLSIWNLLLAGDSEAGENEPPALLRQWRGDREAHLRCADAEGWIWAARWADATAASTFAAFYNALPATATEEVGLPRSADVDGEMTWAVPPALTATKAQLQSHLQIRTFGTLADWKREGCFPQDGCN